MKKLLSMGKSLFKAQLFGRALAVASITDYGWTKDEGLHLKLKINFFVKCDDEEKTGEE